MKNVHADFENHIRLQTGKRKLAIAVSGGVDSAVVAAAALSAVGDQVIAVTAASEFLDHNDLQCVHQVVEHIGIQHKPIPIALLEDQNIRTNDKSRCYHCKRKIFSAIQSEFPDHFIMDGTNSDDEPALRPGMKALSELGVCSPLREKGYGKYESRSLARHYALPNAERVSNSCLATRLAKDKPIDRRSLEIVARLESEVRKAGINDVRVRLDDLKVIIEIPRGSALQLEHCHGEIMTLIRNYGLHLSGYGFRSGVETG